MQTGIVAESRERESEGLGQTQAGRRRADARTQAPAQIQPSPRREGWMRARERSKHSPRLRTAERAPVRTVRVTRGMIKIIMSRIFSATAKTLSGFRGARACPKPLRPARQASPAELELLGFVLACLAGRHILGWPLGHAGATGAGVVHCKRSEPSLAQACMIRTPGRRRGLTECDCVCALLRDMIDH